MMVALEKVLPALHMAIFQNFLGCMSVWDVIFAIGKPWCVTAQNSDIILMRFFVANIFNTTTKSSPTLRRTILGGEWQTGISVVVSIFFKVVLSNSGDFSPWRFLFVLKLGSDRVDPKKILLRLFLVKRISRWWQLKHFLFSPRILGEVIQFDSYFFKRVGSTTK